VLDASFAERFAHEWIEAWNSHDLDRIMAHYAEDFDFASPVIVRVMGEASGRLRGHEAVRAYWSRALALNPSLHFELIAVFAGVDTLAIHYQGVRGPAIEVFHLGPDGRVQASEACYVPVS